MFKTGTLQMTEGRPLVLLSVFALPLLLGNLFQQAYNLADSMIVGRLLGADSLAAVGSTGSISFLFFSLFSGICEGCGIVTSHLFGANREEDVKRCIMNCAYLTLAASAATGLLAFAMTPTVLPWMRTPSQILPEAITYMRMTSASVPFVAIYNYASAMQRALGDSKTPLYFLVFSCVLNVGLDLLFVGVFHWGVFGAAFATMLSQFLAGAGSLLYAHQVNPYFRVERRLRPLNTGILKAALRMGLPLALQWSLIAVSVTALQSTVNTFGAVAVAAYTITNRLEQIVQQPYRSMSMALATYCGQNMGAKKPERIREGFQDSVFAMTTLALAMTLVFFFRGEWFVRLFVREEAVIAMDVQALRITSVFYVALGMIYVVRGVLNGVGDAAFALVNGILEVVGRIGLPLLLIRFWHMGVWACWYTVGLTWLLSALGCLARYFFWRSKVFLHR